MTRIERFMKEVASACRVARGRKADLARHCRVKASTVSDWLAGRAAPDAENLLAIIEWLGSKS